MSRSRWLSRLALRATARCRRPLSALPPTPGRSRGGGFAQNDPAGAQAVAMPSRDFVAEAGEALEHGLAAGEGGLLLEVGGDGVASLGEFGELLRIAVGLAGGGALEQFGVSGGAQGGDFAGEVLQVFQALALLLVFAGGLGEVEDQAVEQQVAALARCSASARASRSRNAWALASPCSSCSSAMCRSMRARRCSRGASCCWRARHCSRVMGVSSVFRRWASSRWAALRRSSAGRWRGRRSLGEQGFRVVAEDAVGQRMQGFAECRAGGIGPGVEGLEQGAGFPGGGGVAGAFPRPGGWRALRVRRGRA